MSLPDRQTQAVIAANRFGLGAREGEIREAEGDPRGWVEQHLDQPPLLGGMPASDKLLVEFLEHAKVQSLARREKAAGRAPRNGEDQIANRYSQNVYEAEVAARTRVAVASKHSLAERLTWFWSNHFYVSAIGGVTVRPIAGAFEREVIRPHVFGSFADMLLASTRHPAMLLYLDNASSIGPRSPRGKRSGKGLNENLGREVLELHTLGVGGGYSQKDVTSFARALTGWSVKRDPLDAPAAGAFVFDAGMHEPGPKTILGRTYPEQGDGEVRAVLEDMAHHPATARHVATKLARHFIADDPPASAVERLSRRFLDTGGDLRVVTRTLIRMDEPWREHAPKIKSPNELVVSALRGLHMEPPSPVPLVSTLSVLGQRPYSAPAPTGWGDTADQWNGAYAISRRIEWASRLGPIAAKTIREPEKLAYAMLGAGASDLLIESIKRASSRQQALSLLLASPEFQRR